MNENRHASLINQYDDFLSLDEVSRVCKISKKSARYLVEHGIIPAINTGNATWKYKIAIVDVITYLYRREKEGSMIPTGAVSSRQRSKNSIYNSNRKSFSKMVESGKEHEIAEYFKYLYSDSRDVLTTNDISEMTGLNRSTIMRFAKQGYIKSIASRPKYLIPKQYLLEFVVTPHYINSRTKSELFIKILGGFEIWRDKKLSKSRTKRTSPAKRRPPVL